MTHFKNTVLSCHALFSCAFGYLVQHPAGPSTKSNRVFCKNKTDTDSNQSRSRISSVIWFCPSVHLKQKRTYFRCFIWKCPCVLRHNILTSIINRSGHQYPKELFHLHTYILVRWEHVSDICSFAMHNRLLKLHLECFEFLWFKTLFDACCSCVNCEQYVYIFSPSDWSLQFKPKASTKQLAKPSCNWAASTSWGTAFAFHVHVIFAKSCNFLISSEKRFSEPSETFKSWIVTHLQKGKEQRRVKPWQIWGENK